MPRPKKTHAHANNAQLLIVDPLNKLNNIGKSSYNFAMIQNELREVYKRLNDELIKFVKLLAARSDGSSDESQADMIDGLIPRILDIDYKITQAEEEVKEESLPSEEKKVKKQSKKKAPAASAIGGQ